MEKEIELARLKLESEDREFWISDSFLKKNDTFIIPKNIKIKKCVISQSISY